VVEAVVSAVAATAVTAAPVLSTALSPLEPSGLSTVAGAVGAAMSAETSADALGGASVAAAGASAVGAAMFVVSAGRATDVGSGAGAWAASALLVGSPVVGVIDWGGAALAKWRVCVDGWYAEAELGLVTSVDHPSSVLVVAVPLSGDGPLAAPSVGAVASGVLVDCAPARVGIAGTVPIESSYTGRLVAFGVDRRGWGRVVYAFVTTGTVRAERERLRVGEILDFAGVR
jgi:type IV secretory pathway TrbL component